MPVNSFEDYPMAWKPVRTQLQRPYYRSIAEKLEQDIRDGTLRAHTKLPPQRELADFLDMNLSTITRAYKVCELKGLLYAVTGRGTFVSPGVVAQDTFLDCGARAIELGMIKPFYETNPEVLRAAQNVLARREAARILEYSEPLGTARQIRAAQTWLEHLGLPVQEGQILLTAGAQNALSVVLIALFAAGDKIAVDEFTYTNFKGLANFLQIQLVAVPGDGLGMRPDALEAACRQAELKGVYLMPACSNPTGIFMPEQRRRALARVVRTHGLLVIEDDIYSFLAPAGTVPLFAMAPEQTVHLCSLSKSLCAGLRVAFLAFPARLRQALVRGLLHINLKTVSLNGEIAAELIETGAAAQIVRQKRLLAEKRNQIFRAVFPDEPEAPAWAFFRWLALPAGMGSEEMEQAALQNGVHVLGSYRFAVQDTGGQAYIRVSVASPDTDGELEKGLRVLKRLLPDNASARK